MEIAAVKSGNPTVVVVRIGFRNDARQPAVAAVLRVVTHMKLACSGPTPTARGDVWEVYLTQHDVPDKLQGLEDLLWECEEVRQSVVTYLPQSPHST